MMKGPGLLLILCAVLAASSSAQYTIDTGDACINNCVNYCVGSSDPQTCAYNCAVNCGYTGGIGITNPDPCEGMTTAAGWPMQWNGASCVDPNAAEHYCSQVASCNACMNRPAYRCIWNGGACVPCNGASCSFSCGGGYVGGDGGNNGGGNANDGNAGTAEDLCGAYNSCLACTGAAQGGNADLEYCAWFPVEGICHDRRIEALTVITSPEGCGTADGGNGNNGAGGNGGGTSGNGTGSCPLATLGLFAVPLGALFRRKSG